MKVTLLILIAASAFAPGSLLKAETKTLKVWPGTAPGETVALPPEVDVTTAKDRRPGGRPAIRISNVSTPTLTIYSPEQSRNTGAAVLVCPGGAYVRLAMDIEGSEICQWLNSIGVTGIILKYRVPRRAGLPQYLPPLQDAQRALGLIRSQSADLGVDPNRIGIIGFSAGADLAAILSNNYEKRTYDPIDNLDQVSCKPNFVMLIYPGYLVNDKNVIAPELAVSTTKTPPTFIIMTEDDPARVENAYGYYAELKKAKVSAELHIYPVGGHGYGLRPTGLTVATWPDRAADWMKASGCLTPAK